MKSITIMYQDQKAYFNEYKSNTLPFGGITDPEGAKAVARKIFEAYDKDRNGSIDKYEVSPMMVDAYKSINKGFNPSGADVETYLRVLDKDADGRVTYQDIEALAMKYLVGSGGPVPGQYNLGYQKAAQYYEGRAEIANKHFTRYSGATNTIEVNQASSVLSDTFNEMGINYVPNNEEITQYLRTYGTAEPGKLNRNEFIDLFTSVCKRRGF